MSPFLPESVRIHLNKSPLCLDLLLFVVELCLPAAQSVPLLYQSMEVKTEVVYPLVVSVPDRDPDP
jgi:hypothetical protein